MVKRSAPPPGAWRFRRAGVWPTVARALVLECVSWDWAGLLGDTSPAVHPASLHPVGFWLGRCQGCGK